MHAMRCAEQQALRTGMHTTPVVDLAASELASRSSLEGSAQKPSGVQRINSLQKTSSLQRAGSLKDAVVHTAVVVEKSFRHAL